MNLGAIRTVLYRRLNYVPPQPSVVARLDDFINEAHRELVGMPELERIRLDVTPVTAYANVARTGLPPVIARIKAITDRSNQMKLVQTPLADFRLLDPGQASTGGYPLRYAVIGNQAVFRQPATTGLWAASSSASDTTQKVYVESVTTGGYPNQPTLTGTVLIGATRVQIGTLTSHIEVTKFYIDNVGIGSVSLYDAAAAGNEIARIPIGQTNSRYWAVEWWPIPTADATEYVDYERQIYDLTQATDEPLLPPDFHFLVGVGARVKEYEYLDDTRAIGARQLYMQGQDALKAFVNDDGDRLGSLRPTRSRWSRLGGQYPAESVFGGG